MKRPPDHALLIANAQAAIDFARLTREHHRKRTWIGHPQRNTDTRIAERRLQAAMRPLRSALGRMPYDPQNATSFARHTALRQMSRAIQTERRKLWKLRGGKNIPIRKEPKYAKNGR